MNIYIFLDKIFSELNNVEILFSQLQTHKIINLGAID